VSDRSVIPTLAPYIIETIIYYCAQPLIFGLSGELSTILQLRLEESPGIEVSSVVVKVQAFSPTAWSIALVRAAAKDRVSSIF
jgi:hypothetical protein